MQSFRPLKKLYHKIVVIIDDKGSVRQCALQRFDLREFRVTSVDMPEDEVVALNFVKKGSHLFNIEMRKLGNHHIKMFLKAYLRKIIVLETL